jgi:hypothetical protein
MISFCIPKPRFYIAYSVSLYSHIFLRYTLYHVGVLSIAAHNVKTARLFVFSTLSVIVILVQTTRLESDLSAGISSPGTPEPFYKLCSSSAT